MNARFTVSAKHVHMHCGSYNCLGDCYKDKMIGERTFVMVQLCHSNDLDHSSFVARLLFGFLPYFLPFKKKKPNRLVRHLLQRQNHKHVFITHLINTK
jgi:hypothetical protein